MIRKKKAYMKYFFRSLKKEIRRILSIIAIVSLSVGFLIGLLSSTPDLQTTVNHYIKDYQVNDCLIKSTVGFSDEIICFLKEEIDFLKKTLLVQKVMPNRITKIYFEQLRHHWNRCVVSQGDTLTGTVQIVVQCLEC